MDLSLAATLVSALLTLLGAVSLAPAMLFYVECQLARPPRRGAPPTRARRELRGGSRRPPGAAAGPRRRLTVLVPAHDEAALLPATLEALRPELLGGDEILVVADNCTDDTAARARAAGARVVERHEPARRGKGYALACGVGALSPDPPEVVVILDADCVFTPGSLQRLARAALASGAPVQARNTVRPPAWSHPALALSAFAFLVRNVVRPSGAERLGLPAPLLGTGMAFPWALLADAPLRTGALAEDLQLGLDLAVAGHPPRLCLEAAVHSPMPPSPAAEREQRRRWEYGHLAALLGRLPRLLGAALSGRSPELLGLALDLCIPPLSALMALCGAGLGLSLAAAWLLGASTLPAWLFGGASGLVTAAVVRAWWRFARGTLPLTALLGAPAYVLRKLPLYAGFLRSGPRPWMRTERATPPTGGPQAAP